MRSLLTECLRTKKVVRRNFIFCNFFYSLSDDVCRFEPTLPNERHTKRLRFSISNHVHNKFHFDNKNYFFGLYINNFQKISMYRFYSVDFVTCYNVGGVQSSTVKN